VHLEGNYKRKMEKKKGNIQGASRLVALDKPPAFSPVPAQMFNFRM
jgi:hypothetical protein